MGSKLVLGLQCRASSPKQGFKLAGQVNEKNWVVKPGFCFKLGSQATV